jgi:hypothetical protein
LNAPPFNGTGADRLGREKITIVKVDEEQLKINILNQFRFQKTRDPDFLGPDPDPAFQVIPYLGYGSK